MLDTLARPNGGAPNNTALQSYGRIALDARVAGASPHQLIAMLYQRLESLMREAHEAARFGNSARRLRATERALTIVDGLDTTLDMKRGGDVARALHEVYGLLRSRLLDGRAEGLGEAVNSVGEIRAAWVEMAAQLRGIAAN
ncbi:MAG: hypothetical protein DI568_13330 [Sphingomonas sp.]|nr:MAG: hypothetical protein DI568_13330 [Sphingomonas sp.]